MALKYKGYAGRAEYDDEAGVFHGEIIGLRDVITFQGTNVEELETEFRESINIYLDWCEEEGVDPDRPVSGQFRLRVGPDLHRSIAMTCEMAGESINSWVIGCIKRGLEEQSRSTAG